MFLRINAYFCTIKFSYMHMNLTFDKLYVQLSFENAINSFKNVDNKGKSSIFKKLVTYKSV